MGGCDDIYALSSYDFPLPPECIAQHPAARREESRLLMLRGDSSPEHRIFRELPELLQPGDLLVRNDTRVIPARLIGKRPGGGKVEALLTHPSAYEATREVQGCEDDALTAATAGWVRWRCLARPAGHLKPGKELYFADGALRAVVLRQLGEGRVELAFDFPEAGAFLQAVEECGQMPLPPYIDRKTGGVTAQDRERYQTTFAREAGAVAAPTAGLHFTPELDDALRTRGVEIAQVTLHVGPGTFRPVQTEDVRAHRMHGEYYRVSPETAAAVNAARAAGRRIVAVGTTSARTLEYAAHLAEAAGEPGTVRAGEGWDDLYIMPGYRWRIVGGLVTNFHLPKSSLLLLVSALAGRERVLAAYREAIARQYRFYSYGDAMLLLPGVAE